MYNSRIAERKGARRSSAARRGTADRRSGILRGTPAVDWDFERVTVRLDSIPYIGYSADFETPETPAVKFDDLARVNRDPRARAIAEYGVVFVRGEQGTVSKLTSEVDKQLGVGESHWRLQKAFDPERVLRVESVSDLGVGLPLEATIVGESGKIQVVSSAGEFVVVNTALPYRKGNRPSSIADDFEEQLSRGRSSRGTFDPRFW